MQVPSLVRAIAHRCHDVGGRALLVGGSVRDHLMGRPVKDWDVEVYGVEPDALERLLKRLGRVNTVGRAFSVFKLRAGGSDVDVSIPRRDSQQGRGHTGIVAVGDPTMTPQEAARRRDLTINAIMLDLLTGELVDPYDGQRDLTAGVLRAVDADTFLEDPLRALRVVQFAARLGFDPDDALIAFCREASLEDLPAERIQGEWAKLFLAARRPSVGFAVARRAALLERLFPELTDDPSVDARLDRATALRDALDPEGRRWALMLGVWLYDAPSDAVAATLDRLSLFRWFGYPLRDRLLALHAAREAPTGTDADLRRLSDRTEVGLVLRVRQACVEDPLAAEHLARAEVLGIAHEPPEPLLRGRDLTRLGVRPGPAMGEVLDRAWALQLDGDLTTVEEARAWAATVAATVE